MFELLIDASFKYGTLRMVLDIYGAIEDFRLKPNASIMTNFLSAISRASKTMEEVQMQIKKTKKESDN